MKNHENRIDFESISVAGGQIELALVIYLRQFYAQQIFYQVHCTLAQLLRQRDQMSPGQTSPVFETG